MRSFSVVEQLLPVNAMFQSAPIEAETVLRYGQRMGARSPWDNGAGETQGALSVGLLDRKIHVVGPSQTTLRELLDTIRVGRALADKAARTQNRRAVALASPVVLHNHLEDVSVRHDRMRRGTRRGDVLCGSVISVAVDSPEEGVQVLDRLRVWLPVLLALSTNSPFDHETLSRNNSHRYLSCSAWPRSGPCEVFGSLAAYEQQRRHLTHPAAGPSAELTNLDAQLSVTRERVDVMLTDVSMDAEHAAVVAAICRALVEVMARQWRAGTPPAPASAAELRVATGYAAMNGLDAELVNPRSGRLCDAQDVVLELMRLLRPVLVEYGEGQHVATVIEDMLLRGNGSRLQRDVYQLRHEPRDVVEAALRGTHNPNHTDGVPGAILAESWNLNSTEQLTKSLTHAKNRAASDRGTGKMSNGMWSTTDSSESYDFV